MKFWSTKMFKVATYFTNQDFANFRRLEFTKPQEFCRFLKRTYIFFYIQTNFQNSVILLDQRHPELQESRERHWAFPPGCIQLPKCLTRWYNWLSREERLVVYTKVSPLHGNKCVRVRIWHELDLERGNNCLLFNVI